METTRTPTLVKIVILAVIIPLCNDYHFFILVSITHRVNIFFFLVKSNTFMYLLLYVCMHVCIKYSNLTWENGFRRALNLSGVVIILVKSSRLQE